MILAGAFATQRKSALVVPVAVVAAMVVMRPREAIRLAPIGVVMLLAMPIVAPGALGSIRNQLFTTQVAQSNSTTGRTEDYAAVQPDLAAHPTFGRGYGSYDPHKYRIIDNQYIGLAIETGFVGVGAYLLMLLGVVAAVAAGAAVGRPAPRAARPRRRVRRGRHRRRRGAVRLLRLPAGAVRVPVRRRPRRRVLGRGDPGATGRSGGVGAPDPTASCGRSSPTCRARSAGSRSRTDCRCG